MKNLGPDLQIMKMTYVPTAHSFDVEYLVKDNNMPQIKRLNAINFPHHEPITFLNSKFKIGESVKIWFKDVNELKKLGWKTNTEKSSTLISDKHPYSIGKKKGSLLGQNNINGYIGVNAKMKPYVVVKGKDNNIWRFTEHELRFVVSNVTFSQKGKNASLEGGVLWTYDADKHEVKGTTGAIGQSHLNDLISLLRKAEVI